MSVQQTKGSKSQKPKNHHRRHFETDKSHFVEPAILKNPEKFKKPEPNQIAYGQYSAKSGWTHSSDSEASGFGSDLSGFKVACNSKVLVDETDDHVEDCEKKAAEFYASSKVFVSPNPSHISIPSFA